MWWVLVAISFGQDAGAVRDPILESLVASIDVGERPAEKPEVYVADPVAAMPITQELRSAIEGEIKEALVDPESAVFQWFPVSDRHIYCGRFNARNRSGGFNGFTPFILNFRKTSDQPYQISDLVIVINELQSTELGQRLLDRCKSAGFHIDRRP